MTMITLLMLVLGKGPDCPPPPPPPEPDQIVLVAVIPDDRKFGVPKDQFHMSESGTTYSV